MSLVCPSTEQNESKEIVERRWCCTNPLNKKDLDVFKSCIYIPIFYKISETEYSRWYTYSSPLKNKPNRNKNKNVTVWPVKKAQVLISSTRFRIRWLYPSLWKGEYPLYIRWLANRNNLHRAVLFQVFRSNTNNYMDSSYYFYSIIIICLHTVKWFHVNNNYS